MKPRTEKSMELYRMLLNMGYPREFCEAITHNLNTDFTASRMMGYLKQYEKLGVKLPLEEIADEMLAILTDRNRIMQKKNLEANNEKWNNYLSERRYLEDEEDD